MVSIPFLRAELRPREVEDGFAIPRPQQARGPNRRSSAKVARLARITSREHERPTDKIARAKLRQSTLAGDRQRVAHHAFFGPWLFRMRSANSIDSGHLVELMT